MRRALTCDAAVATGDEDTLRSCLEDTFATADLRGKVSPTDVDEFVATSMREVERRAGRARVPVLAMSSGEDVAILWVETGSYTGTFEGTEIEGAAYGILGVSIWRNFENQAFGELWTITDPNMLRRQISESPRSSHEPMELPSTKPALLVRDEESDSVALAAAKRRIEALNAHDFESLSSLYADDVQAVVTSNATDVVGKVGVLGGLPQSWQVYPDVRVEVDEMWASGPHVFVRGRYIGTNRGGFGQGVEATNRGFVQPFVEFLEFSGGKLIKYYRIVDTLDVVKQIGLLEDPATAWKKADDDAADSSTSTDTGDM